MEKANRQDPDSAIDLSRSTGIAGKSSARKEIRIRKSKVVTLVSVERLTRTTYSNVNTTVNNCHLLSKNRTSITENLRKFKNKLIDWTLLIIIVFVHYHIIPGDKQ